MSVQAIRDLIEAVRDERAATGQPASDLDYIAAEVDALAAVVAERDALRAALTEIAERSESIFGTGSSIARLARRVLAGEAAAPEIVETDMIGNLAVPKPPDWQERNARIRERLRGEPTPSKAGRYGSWSPRLCQRERISCTMPACECPTGEAAPPPGSESTANLGGGTAASSEAKA